MKAFLYKLIARPTFLSDLTEAEAKIMQEHVTYWKGLVDKGIAITFGLVLDPKNPWGVGIFEALDQTAAQTIAKNDPAITSGLHTFELYPMRSATTRK